MPAISGKLCTVRRMAEQTSFAAEAADWMRQSRASCGKGLFDVLVGCAWQVSLCDSMFH